MKVIFFDIDGTITNFKGEIAPSTIEGIHKAREKGNAVALCSGRSESQIYDYILDIGFDAIVSAAGARVSVGGKAIYEEVVDKDMYKKCLDLVLPMAPSLCVQTNECVYIWEKGVERLDSVFPAMEGEDRKASERIGFLVPVADLYKVEKAQKFFYHKAPMTVEEIERELGGYFADTMLSFGDPDPYSGEITIRGIEKSTGMEKLMQYYGLSAKDSVAFGDGPNDLDMMGYAGLSICMGNGLDEVKRVADYICPSVDDDGIYEGLSHFGLI